jgi:hypothetical protein
MADFKLQKWYLDVADDSPATFIGYAATLTYNALSMSYSGYTLLHQQNLRKKNSFLSHPHPEMDGDQLRWNTRFAKGVWRAADHPVSELLLHDGKKSILWECFFPRAQASVTVDKAVIRGYGYAEKLTLSFVPWELPIEKLHWGRYLTETEYIIWIRWEGPEPRNIIYHNGVRTTTGVISDFLICFGDYRLTLTDSVALRKGRIGSTVFNRVQAIRNLFPKSILQLEENKWLSRGSFTKSGEQISQGQAVHEKVIWN